MEEVARTVVRGGPQVNEEAVRLAWTPKALGERKLSLVVVPQEGEVVLTNNELLDVRRGGRRGLEGALSRGGAAGRAAIPPPCPRREPRHAGRLRVDRRRRPAQLAGQSRPQARCRIRCLPDRRSRCPRCCRLRISGRSWPRSMPALGSPSSAVSTRSRRAAGGARSSANCSPSQPTNLPASLLISRSGRGSTSPVR